MKAELGIGKRPDDGLIYRKEWFDISSLQKDTSFRAKYTFKEGLLASLRADKENENG